MDETVDTKMPNEVKDVATLSLDGAGAAAQVAQEPAVVAPVIPKSLHIIWVGPHYSPDKCIESWVKAHPPERGWTVKVWDDHRGFANQHIIDKIISHRRAWHGVADVMRWEILSGSKGGICVDADSECLRALDEPGAGGRGPVINFFDLEAWSHYESETARPGVIGCGAMGGSPHALVFAKCVEAVSMVDVTQGQLWEIVGPGVLTRVAATLPKGHLKVFPSKLFIPEHFSGAKATGPYPTFARQFWGSTKIGGYNALRSKPCRCPECDRPAWRPAWG